LEFESNLNTGCSPRRPAGTVARRCSGQAASSPSRFSLRDKSPDARQLVHFSPRSEALPPPFAPPQELAGVRTFYRLLTSSRRAVALAQGCLLYAALQQSRPVIFPFCFELPSSPLPEAPPRARPRRPPARFTTSASPLLPLRLPSFSLVPCAALPWREHAGEGAFLSCTHPFSNFESSYQIKYNSKKYKIILVKIPSYRTTSFM
jgi:hypothetical protein